MSSIAMGKKNFLVVFMLLLLFGCFSSASAATLPAKFLGGFLSNAMSSLFKWFWSVSSTAKTAITSRPLMKFESGYSVETVFDGSKLGIEPFSVEVLPSGDLLILDSANSNIYKMSLPLSLYSRPKLVAGSADGYSGHVDGRPREARMNHPKGFTVDDRGNIYVADTMNMAIRKISDSSVTTIAGGKWNLGGHVDGPSEDAKFSNDFEVIYIGSSCSLLVIDRGNQAIREIQLHFDDCAYQYGSGFPLGIAVLVSAVFFGYMLALLQYRVCSMVSSKNEISVLEKQEASFNSYEKSTMSSVRPPLIPVDGESEKQEGLFQSIWMLFINAGSGITENFGGFLPRFWKKPPKRVHWQQLQRQQQQPQPNVWQTQESFVIPDEDEPPSLDTRTPTPRKTYAFMEDPQKTQHFRLGQSFYSSGVVGSRQQQQKKQQQHENHHYSSVPHTYYEPSCETGEIVFGAGQEGDAKRKTVEIKAVDYGNPMHKRHDIYSQVKYTDYSYNY